MVDSPSSGAAAKAPRWDLADTEGCGGGIRFLWCSSMISGYMGIYRRKKYVGGCSRGLQGWGARYPLGAHPTLVGPSSIHRPTSSSYIYPCTLKPSRSTTKNYFHRHKPSVSARSHLGAFTGTPSEGESTMEGLYIISKALPMSCA